MDWLIPEGVSALAVLALTAASFATSFVTAAFGIGGGLLLIAIMAVLLPPAAVIAVHGVVQFGSNAGRTLLMRTDIKRPVIVPFLVGSTLGAAIGGLVVVELPPPILQLALAGFILWSTWGRIPALGGRHAQTVTGAISSFLSMFVGATGPFVAATLKTLDLDRQAFVATHGACMTGQHLVKVLAFGVLGFAFADYVPLIVLMVATGFGGTWTGRLVLLRRNDAGFHRVLTILLTLLALRLLWSGLAGLR